MRIAIALVTLAVTAGWTTAPDGLSARIANGPHSATLTCTQPRGLRVEVDAPGDLDTIILANGEMSLNLRGRTENGRFASEMALDGISALVMRSDGSLKVGTGDGAYIIEWIEAAPVIDRLVRGCGAAT